MLVAALVLNILILVPVVLGVLRGTMDEAFGQDTDARRILVCVYIAIACVSAGLIGLHAFTVVWAAPMTLALFSVQITYKLCTIMAVGLTSPVVVTNLVVVTVQIAAMIAWSVTRA